MRNRTDHLRRRRLRSPAVLGILLLLVGSGVDASGFGVCRTHGHGLHDHSVEHQGVEQSDSRAPGSVDGHAPSHHHHHDHHAHTPPSDGLAAEPATATAGTIPALPEHGCECRMVCAAAVGAPAPAPGMPDLVEQEPPTEHRTLAATDDPVPFHLLPFALPFANGPPPVA